MEYSHRPGPGPPPPRYVMLSDQNSMGGGGVYGQSSLRPPPGRRNLPRYQSAATRSSSGCCCGCLCWCCVFLLLFILVGAGIAVYLFVILDPKPPSYSVNNFEISAFDVNPQDLSLHAKFVVSVRAENPNSAIGIAYGRRSHVAVVYRNITLCAGKLPEFYQGYRNVTVVRVVMEGKEMLGSGIEKPLLESQQEGSVPIDVYVTVPVTLRLLSFDLRQVTVNVDCMLVVDSLTPGKKINIKSTKYRVNVEF